MIGLQGKDASSCSSARTAAAMVCSPVQIGLVVMADTPLGDMPFLKEIVTGGIVIFWHLAFASLFLNLFKISARTQHCVRGCPARPHSKQWPLGQSGWIWRRPRGD